MTENWVPRAAHLPARPPGLRHPPGQQLAESGFLLKQLSIKTKMYLR